MLNITPEELQNQMQQHIQIMIGPLNAQIMELKLAVTEASNKEKDHIIKVQKMEEEKKEHEMIIGKMAKMLKIRRLDNKLDSTDEEGEEEGGVGGGSKDGYKGV